MNRLVGLWHTVALYKSSEQLGLTLSQAVGNEIGSSMHVVRTVHLQHSMLFVLSSEEVTR